MKTNLITLLTLAMVLCTGCREEEMDFYSGLLSKRHTPELVNVHVGFSSGENNRTKSVATAGVENFTDAFLFAFWASGADSGKPCMVDGQPVAKYTGSKSFDWALPSGEPIEVMAVVNAVEDVRRELDKWVCGLVQYSMEELLDLKFTCENAGDLEDLEYREYNMPMSGRVTVTLDPDAPSLTVPVKRLFAKFDITLDVSAWADDGWTVNAARVSGARSNTEVPYFHTGSGAGFKQTDPAKFASVDTSTADDLEDLNFRDSGNRSRAVTYYFLENCQDVTASASRWSTVALDLGSAVANCSYLKVNVTATKPGYGQRKFGYRIYLDSSAGSGMKSGFNIIRNTSRSIVLKLGTPQDGFLWTNTSAITVAPGNTVSIPFETSLGGSELAFSVQDARLEYVSHTFQEGNNPNQITSFPSSGTAVFRALGSAPDGNYSVKGGNSGGDISDETTVKVVSPVTITSSFPSSHYAFQRFMITFSSASMAEMGSEQKARIESAFNNLGLRGLSDDIHIVFDSPTYHTSVNGTQDVVNKQFQVMVTKAGVATFQLYNTLTDAEYKNLYISITAPSIKYVHADGTTYTNPVYDIPITGEDVEGYFKICDQFGNALTIAPADLALGTLELVPASGFSASIGAYSGLENTYAFTACLENWNSLDGWRSNVDGTCTFTSETVTTSLELRSESGYEVCSKAVRLKVSNPFNDWFPDGDFTPYSYTVTLDGNTDYAVTDEFYHDWPASSGLQPEVLQHGNVNTSKGTYAPYTLVWEYSSNEIDYIRIANDLRNWGRITLGKTITHINTGSTMTMLWGKVNVIREYIIYAGYQFSQVNYLSSASTPYSNGNMSRFIPYIFVRDNTGMPVTLGNCVRTTAAAATGINAVNPSEDFYRETCADEHWWHDGSNYMPGATDHTGATLWDCEYASTARTTLLQNKVVVYPSPKTVTSAGELSYYELQYAGPRIETALSWVLGHNGHHADFVYSFRDVAYWNEPAFEFSTAGISSGNNPEIRTFPSGETYLALGDFTRYRFFWKMKKASLTRLNSYDTRYAISYTQLFQTTYTNTSDPSYRMYYFGEAMTKSASRATAYYDPRRNIREKMKLYTPSIPYYRLKGNTVYAAFDGAVTGTYTEEDIVNTHKMGQAYGNSDSFWLPGNQIN